MEENRIQNLGNHDLFSILKITEDGNNYLLLDIDKERFRNLNFKPTETTKINPKDCHQSPSPTPKSPKKPIEAHRSISPPTSLRKSIIKGRLSSKNVSDKMVRFLKQNKKISVSKRMEKFRIKHKCAKKTLIISKEVLDKIFHFFFYSNQTNKQFLTSSKVELISLYKFLDFKQKQKMTNISKTFILRNLYSS